jgi:hypothetical protein
MHGVSASGAGVFWFTAVCAQYFSSGGVRCSKNSGSFRSQNFGVYHVSFHLNIVMLALYPVIVKSHIFYLNRRQKVTQFLSLTKSVTN